MTKARFDVFSFKAHLRKKSTDTIIHTFMRYSDISQIQLIRFHHKEEKDEPKNDTENKADSLRRTPDASGNSADTTRRGNIPRKGSPVLSAKEGTSVYRVGNVELKPAKR